MWKSHRCDAGEYYSCLIVDKGTSARLWMKYPSMWFQAMVQHIALFMIYSTFGKYWKDEYRDNCQLSWNNMPYSTRYWKLKSFTTIPWEHVVIRHRQKSKIFSSHHLRKRLYFFIFGTKNASFWRESTITSASYTDLWKGHLKSAIKTKRCTIL